MNLVLLTALGIGGATVFGTVLGFIFKNISHKFSDIVLSFAAGVMLCASITGLIMPALEYEGKYIFPIVVAGIICGAITLNLIDKLIPHLHRLGGADIENHPEASAKIHKVLLFVLAIAIHNFPEGIAAGVGFGAENTSGAISVAIGIALQNIPEGMIIITPMLSSGISKFRTFIIALSTGIVEVIGTFLGYFAASASAVFLPFALSFAGGTMLYVISDEMIPETHAHGSERSSTFSLLIGFCVMLFMDFYIG